MAVAHYSVENESTLLFGSSRACNAATHSQGWMRAVLS